MRSGRLADSNQKRKKKKTHDADSFFRIECTRTTEIYKRQSMDVLSSNGKRNTPIFKNLTTIVPVPKEEKNSLPVFLNERTGSFDEG